MLFWLLSNNETHGSLNFIILRNKKDPGQVFFFFSLEIQNNTWENKAYFFK